MLYGAGTALRSWAGFDSPPCTLILRYHPSDNDDGFGYWQALAECWHSLDMIINVEWDMEFSNRLVAELLACPHPLCSHAYRMWVPREYYAHSHNKDGIGGYWIARGEEWPVWSAIGFCKITPDARVGDLERSPWRAVETAVNRAVAGPWHIHWPEIRHHHTRDGQTLTTRAQSVGYSN